MIFIHLNNKRDLFITVTGKKRLPCKYQISMQFIFSESIFVALFLFIYLFILFYFILIHLLYSELLSRLYIQSLMYVMTMRKNLYIKCKALLGIKDMHIIRARESMSFRDYHTTRENKKNENDIKTKNKIKI